MTSSPETFLMSVSGEMMEVLNQCRLDQKMAMVKEDPFQKQILRIILKYEMQSLLHKLAEVGEESIIVTANLVDGTHSALASEQGEKFLHSGVVSTFMDHFVHYLTTGEASANAFTDETNMSDGYVEKYGVSQQENKLSRSSVSSSDEPETFMHMKKHQVEQFNRRREYEDHAIDETVSNLVQNILREGKEKERRKRHLPGYSYGYLKRKRMQNNSISDRCNNEHRKFTGMRKKPLHVADFFPTLSKNVKNKDSNDILPEAENKISENTTDEIVMIKIEPPDDDAYGGVVVDSSDGNNIEDGFAETGNSVAIISDNTGDENTEKVVEIINVMGENSESVNSKDQFDEQVLIVENNGETSNTNSDKSNHSSSSLTVEETVQRIIDKVKVKTEEDIDLPFVEEYYQDRTKCLEDVKLKPEEVSSNKNVSCYRQSRKKSNTFNLVLNGYLYIKDKQSSSGTVYWKCGRIGCKGRVIQRGQELITSQAHIHDPAYKQEVVDT